MARKAKRRVFRRPMPQQRNVDTSLAQRQLEATARALLSSRTAEQLGHELAAREELLAEADRQAQLDPSPANLSRYRVARSEYDTARVALELLNNQDDTRGATDDRHH